MPQWNELGLGLAASTGSETVGTGAVSRFSVVTRVRNMDLNKGKSR